MNNQLKSCRQDVNQQKNVSGRSRPADK